MRYANWTASLLTVVTARHACDARGKRSASMHLMLLSDGRLPAMQVYDLMMADASYTINDGSLALVVRAFLSLGQHQDAYQTLERHSTLARTMRQSRASDIFTDTIEQLKRKASFHWSLVDIVMFCLQIMPKAADQDGRVSEVVHVCLARGRTKLAFDVSPPHPHAAEMHISVGQLCLQILQSFTSCS